MRIRERIRPSRPETQENVARFDDTILRESLGRQFGRLILLLQVNQTKTEIGILRSDGDFGLDVVLVQFWKSPDPGRFGNHHEIRNIEGITNLEEQQAKRQNK